MRLDKTLKYRDFVNSKFPETTSIKSSPRVAKTLPCMRGRVSINRERSNFVSFMKIYPYLEFSVCPSEARGIPLSLRERGYI